MSAPHSHEHHDVAPPEDDDPVSPVIHHVEHDFTGPLSPGVASLLRWFGGACIVLFVFDFLIERKTHAPMEHLPGFYPVYGFVGCVLLVLLAKELRKFVMRDEAYYDKRGKR